MSCIAAANRVSSTDVREESNKGPQQVAPVENQVKDSEEDVHDGRTGPSKLPNILVRGELCVCVCTVQAYVVRVAH